MIKIENVDVFGWEAAIRGMRNPKNSWDESDSVFYNVDNVAVEDRLFIGEYEIGQRDLKLMKTLSKAGTDHGKFLRMIHVQVDVTAPLYWWKEADQYKVGTVTDSCSTMHKIHAKEFTPDDFSCERLLFDSFGAFNHVINLLNKYRDEYVRTGNRTYWLQMIQLLPSSYNQKRTWDLNYGVLKAIYHARNDHKLDEWKKLCKWIETLPYAKELIVGE